MTHPGWLPKMRPGDSAVRVQDYPFEVVRIACTRCDRAGHAAPDGWTVLRELGGWRFRLVALIGSIQVIATPPSGGQPAVWVVRGST